MQTVPSTALQQWLTALTTSSGPLSALTWRLYSNPAVITPGITLAALTEAAFDGYAPVVGSSWGSPLIDAAGNGVVIGGNAQFEATDGTVVEQEYGYYATSGSGSGMKLELVEAFPGPVGITKAGDGCVVQQMVGLPGPVAANVTLP